LPIWGRRKREAQEALSSAKEIIIKVKKKGIDTSLAEGLYKEAKKAIKNRKYSDALQKMEEAKKSAKLAYAKGIKGRLQLRISMLEKKIGEMKAKNLETKVLSISLKKAKTSLKGGVKDYKQGLKAAKEGLGRAEEKLEKFERFSGYLVSTGTLLRRMGDYSPDLSVLKVHKERLLTLEKLKSNGKIETGLKEAKNLFEDVKNTMDRLSEAYDSIKALEKVVKDGDVLGANIDSLSKLQDAKALLNEAKFESTCKIADKSREEISAVLKKHKDARYHVNMAQEKVTEVKSWGFSAFEAERELNSAKDALKNHEFEKAIALSKESKEKAGKIRERHKRLSELIRSAKEEVGSLRAKGVDTSDIEQIISEAENEFYKGDYGASEEIIDRVFEAVKEGN
jgi:hypothetical protein